MQGRKIRILLTKSAMDTHDMGMAYVRMKCQEAGMEVIVTQHGVVDEIINTAIQESVDVIGVSFHSGGQLYCGSRTMELLEAQKINDILVIFGGAIPPGDEAKLLKMGVDRVFTPGSPIEEIVSFINSKVQSKQKG